MSPVFCRYARYEDAVGVLQKAKDLYDRSIGTESPLYGSACERPLVAFLREIWEVKSAEPLKVIDSSKGVPKRYQVKLRPCCFVPPSAFSFYFSCSAMVVDSDGCSVPTCANHRRLW